MADFSKPIAIVLAGGRGQRMGDVDKGLESFLGRPLVAHVLERILPQVSAVLISANRNLDRYRSFGFPVIPDESPDFPGPLEGLRSALRQVTQPFWLSVPCDTPNLPLDLVERLQETLLVSEADLAVPEILGAAERVVCLGRLSLLPGLDRFVSAGKRRVGEWQQGLNTVYAPFADPGNFANLNDRAVLQRTEEMRRVAGEY